MSELLRDMSPLQIGTTGFYDGHKFQIVGRQKLSWSRGFWLEWYLQFTDGRNAWLAEAQGFYAVSFATSESVPALETLKPERELGIRGQAFTVDDIKEAAISEKSGEGPGVLNSSSTVVDLTGADGAFASIDFGTKTLFLGRYVEFPLFKFSNLKPASSPASSSSTFKFDFACPSCGKPMSLLNGSQRAVCASCSSLVDATEDKPEVVGHPKKINQPLDIPIGTKGKVHGIDYQVIGYLERHDGPYYWSEYLLLSGTLGYRWLFEMNGHWSLIETLKDKPKTSVSDSTFGIGARSAQYRGKKFRLFNVGNAVVSKMAGEFYWQVTNGETVSMEDYIHPPEMLSVERSKDEVIWSLGTYVDANVVRKAFGLKSMPAQTGVAANQGTASTAPEIVKYWLVFIAALIGIQVVHKMGAEDKIVYQKQFFASATDVVKTQASEPFTLNGGDKNVEIFFAAPVTNNWVEVQGELVNDQTGVTYEFEQGIEFYSGSDSDGPWSEGSQSTEIDLSAIPGGTYHVNFEASGPGVPTMSPIAIMMTVERNVSMWSNFWWSVILISIFPFFVWMRSRSFEMRRWSNSDFSPYAGSGS